MSLKSQITFEYSIVVVWSMEIGGGWGADQTTKPYIIVSYVYLAQGCIKQEPQT